MGIGNRAIFTNFFYKPPSFISAFLANAFLLKGNLAPIATFRSFVLDHLHLILLYILPTVLIYLLSILGIIFIGYFLFRISPLFSPEKQARFSLEMINEINAAKLKFFMDAEKEYANPLNLIINPTETAISIEGLPTDLKGLVNTIENKEKILKKLNGTDFDNQTSDNHAFTLVKSDLGDFIERTIRTFQAYSLKKELRFNIDILPNTIIGWYDPTIVEKILINLLTVISDSAEKNVKVIIRMTLKANDLAIFEISADNQTNDKKKSGQSGFKGLFANFLKGDKKNESKLKLYLSKQLICLHKGAIELYSPVTNANHYTLFIPIGKANYDTSSIEQETQTVALSSENKPLENIDKTNQVAHEQTLLVVDDNSEIRKFVNEIFAETFHVIKAENGIIGYELALEHIPDIIITDVMMPEMTGFELTSKLKNNEQTNHIPLILLTALNDFESQKTAYEEGGDIYISKPFSPQLLKLQVNNLITTRRKKAVYEEENPIIKPAVNTIEKVETIDSADNEFLQTINKYLEENYDSTELNVHALAKETFMSYIQFYRKFKAITGINAKEYIRTFRLKKAAIFLQNEPEKSVNEIMHKVGFSGQSYFSASFKKQFGVTPSEFKANNTKPI